MYTKIHSNFWPPGKDGPDETNATSSLEGMREEQRVNPIHPRPVQLRGEKELNACKRAEGAKVKLDHINQ